MNIFSKNKLKYLKWGTKFILLLDEWAIKEWNLLVIMWTSFVMYSIVFFSRNLWTHAQSELHSTKQRNSLQPRTRKLKCFWSRRTEKEYWTTDTQTCSVSATQTSAINSLFIHLLSWWYVVIFSADITYFEINTLE